mmetsp:Transcript_44977/g.113127  ORF Transcript_44977/g.113127 Transcript_44977/m.113127 type:complete len:269 (+) Transcript_44977:1136-1942(+)
MLATRVRILASEIADAVASVLAIVVAIAIRLLDCLAGVKINLAQLAEALKSLALEQVVHPRRDAEPSDRDQALNGFQGVLSGSGSTVLGPASAQRVSLSSVSIRTLWHDPIRAPDLVHCFDVPKFDLDQSRLVPFPHVPELVTLRGRSVATRETTQLVPNESFDAEAAGIILLHEPVVSQNVAEVIPETNITRISHVCAAIKAVAMESQVCYQRPASRRALACLEKVVKPTSVVSHRRAHKLCVAFRLSNLHVRSPSLRICLRVGPQV